MLHHVRPPRHGRFQPNHLLEVTPQFFERVIRRLRRSKVDLVSLDEMHRRLTDRRFSAPPLRLHHLRRRLPRQSRIRLSGPEEIRGAVRDLCGDELRRPHRRIVVARARSGDRAERHDRHSPRRPRPLVRVPQRQGQARGVRPHLLRGCGSFRPRRSCGRWCAICARATASTSPAFCADLCMGWDELADARRRSAGDDRRAHRQPSDPDQARRQGGARRAGQQPRRDRGGARRAAGASGLSGRRPLGRRPARIPDRRASSASRPR